MTGSAVTNEGIWSRHSEDCPLSDPAAWQIEDDEMGYSATKDCICKEASEREPGRVFVSGAWCAPSFSPEVQVSRGGLSFTSWDSYAKLTKKQLRRLLVERMEELSKERRRVGKLRRKNRRLLKIIDRLAGAH